MKYPYIANNNLMFYAKDTATFVGDEDNLNTQGFKIAANESKFTNITREYLEGKCVKIESPEHSEFVQKLAFNAGFAWSASGRELKHQTSNFLSFHKCGLLGHTEQPQEKAADLKEITIPLPPKAEPEPKEWPQVGSEFQHKESKNKGVILAIHKGHAFVEYPCMTPISVSVEQIEKPKTEAEILRDELISVMDNSTTAFTYAEHIAKHLIDNYNITKKV